MEFILGVIVGALFGATLRPFIIGALVWIKNKFTN
jgi:hypothetical protein